MDKKGLIEAMIDAYTMEKGTNEFYTRAAANAHEEVARNAFRMLAGWETEHMDYIRYLYQALMEDREQLSFEDFKGRLRPQAVEGNIPVGDVEQWLKDYTFIDELGAIIVALRLEADSRIFYKKLSVEVDEPATRVFLEELMHKEEEHIKYLKDLRLKIEETS